MVRTVFVDVSPLCERHLTGIGRYTARLVLALAGQGDVALRLMTENFEVLAPRGLCWDQDQELSRWARSVWRGRRLRTYSRLTARGQRVRFLGVVSDAELCRLYQTAGWSAYPTLYEGFGLPVLDALRHGTPVLTAFHSSLCELDYQGVHFFDPYDRATVDSAWKGLEAAGSGTVPAVDLDRLHSWDKVARSVLDLPAAVRQASRGGFTSSPAPSSSSIVAA
jgi:hypothetical protein